MPKYPYISGQMALVMAFMQLRKGFPSKVDAGYLKRFNIAPANESYVISILRFLNLIDDEGNKIEDNADFFYGDESIFKQGLESAMRKAYSQLFSEMGDDALNAERSVLTHWFRTSDRTSDLVGSRQASTFQTLASLAGHGEIPSRSSRTNRIATKGWASSKNAAAKQTISKKVAKTRDEGIDSKNARDEEAVQINNEHSLGLTVRIEVNLPPGGDVETYDAIFASIRKHLMS